MNADLRRAMPRAVAALAIAMVGLAGCARHETAPEPVRPVQLTQVRLAPAGTLAVFAGEVRPRHEADLGFRIGGKLVARAVDVGARVHKGQLLARLDPADVTLQSQAARAAAAAADTEYRYAKAEHERYRDLYDQHFVSASALDQKRNALDANRAKLEQANAQLDVTRNQAAYATLLADQEGVVTSVNAEPGQVVNAGQPIVRLAREDEREVAIAVPENRIGEITGARNLVVVLWARPQRPYAAKVREIAPAVDPVTRTFAVRVSILDPDAAVQWGMTANVGVQSATPGTWALLPLPSIYRQDGKPAVWVFDPASGKVQLRQVAIGQFREDGVVIAAGLADGEWVVSAGVGKLQPGQVVRPFDGAPATTPASTPAAPAAPAPAASAVPATAAALRGVAGPGT